MGRTLRIESSDSDLKEFFGQNGVPWNHLASVSCGAWFYLAFFPKKAVFFLSNWIFLFIRTFSLRSSWQLVSSWRMWWVPEFWPCPPPWRTSGYYLEALWNLAALVMDHGAGFSGEMDGHDFGGYTKLDPCTLFWGWRVFRVDWCCVFSAAEKLADYSEGLFA